MKSPWRILVVVLAGGMVAAVPMRGQSISPSDQGEAARFDAIVGAATRAGYTAPTVVGHGTGPTDALFALLATRNDSGVLIALSEPAGSGPAQPAELERDKTPAQLGVRGIQFNGFLGESGVYDVVVDHEPFMLETSRSFETHHVLRRGENGLETACAFPGNDTSSSSKGVGSITGTRRVTVERLSGGATLRFLVRTIDETTEQAPNQAAPVTTAHTESTRQYDLPAAGTCHER
jgi:hypothetical protein